MSSAIPSTLRGKLIGGCYILGEQLGSGGYGDVFIGTHWETGFEVAVKIERKDPRTNYLIHERDLYKTLRGTVGIPNFIWFCKEGLYNALILEKMGPNLHHLFGNCKNALSLKTVLVLAEQMLTCIQVIHEKGIIHRDITTSNFCMGSGCNKDKVFIIDFGLAIKYRDPSTGQHIPCVAENKIVRNTWFGSQNKDAGLQQSRLDDLESIGYVLIYLLKGKLPWLEVKGGNYAELFRKKRDLKTNASAVEVCEHCPSEFVDYLIHCHELRFDETPDYEYLRKLFRNVFKSNNYTNDNRLDWNSATARSISTDDDAVNSSQPIKNEWGRRQLNNMPAVTLRSPVKKMNKMDVITPQVPKVRLITAEHGASLLTKADDLKVTSPPRRAKSSVESAAAPPLSITAGVIKTEASSPLVKAVELTVPGRLEETGLKSAAAPRWPTKTGGVWFRPSSPTPPS